jgi:hypothetical protein
VPPQDRHRHIHSRWQTLIDQTIYMNSYNDNLHTTVVAILNNLELELKADQDQFQDEEVSLFNAQGAQITAREKQQQAAATVEDKSVVVNETTAIKHISKNILTSTNKGKTLVQQSMSTAETAASNIQVAANAIVKLTSSMESVFRITQAAKYDAEINKQAALCSKLIDETAHLAKNASQHTMEASMLTAEVTATAIEINTTKNDTSIDSLLESVTEEFNIAKASLKADTESLYVSSDIEGLAEGTLKGVDRNYTAAKHAYHISNKKMNLELVVITEDSSSKSFTVCFNDMKDPFEDNETRKSRVDKYYILLVKNSKKSTFSIAAAEQLILSKGQYVEVAPSPSISTTILLTQLTDADGDAMQIGQQYTVFVLAKYHEEDKSKINNFENYLTAPSGAFAVSHKLQPPAAAAINFDLKTNTLGFSLTENTIFNVEYRCMYLPFTSNEGGDKPGFIFNLSIAEQVSAGNYSVAVTEKKSDSGKSLIIGTTQLTEVTTDIFGNSLVVGQTYLPVVLSISTEVLIDLELFANSISPFALTIPFTYHPIGSEKQ